MTVYRVYDYKDTIHAFDVEKLESEEHYVEFPDRKAAKDYLISRTLARIRAKKKEIDRLNLQLKEIEKL